MYNAREFRTFTLGIAIFRRVSKKTRAEGLFTIPPDTTGSVGLQPSVYQFSIFDTVRLDGVHAQAAFSVSLIIGVVALEPDDLAFAFKR